MNIKLKKDRKGKYEYMRAYLMNVELKKDRTIPMKLSYASGSSLNAAINSRKFGCIFIMRLPVKYSTSNLSALEPILSEDIYMK